MKHKKNFRAISNMPIEDRKDVEDDFVESRFKPSVKMSTYLVAFIVSDFNNTETFTRKGIKVSLVQCSGHISRAPHSFLFFAVVVRS